MGREEKLNNSIRQIFYIQHLTSPQITHAGKCHHIILYLLKMKLNIKG